MRRDEWRLEGTGSADGLDRGRQPRTVRLELRIHAPAPAAMHSPFNGRESHVHWDEREELTLDLNWDLMERGIWEGTASNSL
jgi:hypothetical protein